MATYDDYLRYLQHVDNTTKQEVTAKIDSLNEEIANLKSSLTNLNKVKEGLADELGKANRKNNEQTDLINQKEVELQIAAKKEMALQNELKQTVSTKNEEIRQLQNDLETSKKETLKSDSEKQKLEKELSKTKSKIEELERTIEKLEGIIKELEKGNSKKHRKILLILSGIIAVLIAIIILLSVFPLRKEPVAPVTQETKVIPPDSVIYVKGFRVVRDSANIFIYSGELKNNLPNGKGSVRYADGRRYEGDFTDGYRQGKGKMLFPNGDVYEGDYVKDKAEGQGEFRYSTGERYVGEWKNDDTNGQGVLYDAAGKEIHNGKWENGNPKQSSAPKSKSKSKEDMIKWYGERAL